MNPFENVMGGGENQGRNLLSIIINVAFGFVIGLVVFLGLQETLALGTKYAEELLNLVGFNNQMGGFGFTSYAPYIIGAPIAGMVVKELSSVRSLKSFAYFAAAVAVGFTISFLVKGNLI